MDCGRCISVHINRLGTSVLADAPTGTQVISVDFPSDFDEFGGTLQHQPTGDTYTYTTRDVNAGTITLTAALPAGKSFTAGDALYVYPLENDYFAQVLKDDVNEEPILARVPHHLRPLLAEGVREPVGEAVRLNTDGVQWTVQDVIGRVPNMDGTFIDPTTIPSNPSDGDPPSSSPTPAVTGGIGSLFVEFDPVVNVDRVTYEVHVSVTTGFTPGAATLAAETGATVVTLRNEPDGTPLEYATTYFVKVIAKDADGAAAASAQGSAQLVQVNTLDLAADAVTEAKIAADAVGTAEIQGNAVTLTELASGAVDATKIVDGAVVQAKIAANAIGANQLAANSVVAGKIAAAAVEAGDLAAGSVQAGNIAAEAIAAGDIAAGAVTTAKLAALGITADKIAANAVVSEKIAADAVTAAKLAAELVLTGRMIAGSPTGTRIEIDDKGIRRYVVGIEEPVTAMLTSGASAGHDFYSVVSAGEVTNRVTNPSFETNTTGWTVAGGTFATSTDQALFGTKSGKLTPNGSSSTPEARIAIPADEDIRYVANAYVYRTSTSAAKPSVFCRFNTSGPVFRAGTSVARNTSGTTYNITIPSTVVTGDFMAAVYAHRAGSAGGGVTQVGLRSSTIATNVGTSTTVTKPAGTVSGDFLLAWYITDPDAESTTLTPPSGWTLLDEQSSGDMEGKIFHRVAGGSEPASYVFGAPSTADTTLIMAAFTGVDTANPIQGSTEIDNGGSSTNLTAPSINLTANGALVCCYGSQNAGTFTTPTGMIEIADGAPDGWTVAAMDWELRSPGETGTRTATHSKSEARIWASVGLKAAGSSPTGGGAPTPPSGWTLQGTFIDPPAFGDLRVGVYTKIAGSTDPGASRTWTAPTSSTGVLVFAAWDGVHGTTPVADFEIFDASGTSTTAPTAPAVNVAGALDVTCIVGRGTSTTTPNLAFLPPENGYTIRSELSNAVSGDLDVIASWADSINVVPQAKPAFTATQALRAVGVRMMLASDASSGLISTDATSFQTLVSDTWTRVTLKPTSPVGTTSIEMGVELEGTPAAADIAYIDGVMLVEDTIVEEDYGDGDQGNWSWSGTAHNSTSTGQKTTKTLANVSSDGSAGFQRVTTDTIELAGDDVGSTISTLSTDVGGLVAQIGSAKLIREFTFSVAGPSVTFSSLPSTYTHLLLVVSALKVNDANLFRSVRIRYNGDTGATNYSWTERREIGDGTDVQGHSGADDGMYPATVGTTQSNCEVSIFNYAQAGIRKDLIAKSTARSGANATSYCTSVGGGQWFTTSAITSIEVALFAGDYAAGSQVQLYGVGGGGAPGGAGGGAGQAEPPPPTKFVKTYGSTWSRSFSGSGTVLFSGQVIYQGEYTSANGNEKAMIGFPSSTIVSDLTDATVLDIEVFLYYRSWYYDDGGVAIIGTHNNTNPVSSWTSVNTDRVRSSEWPKPGGRWVSLGTTIGNEFKNNTAKGITIGPGPTGHLRYRGRADGNDADKEPQLRITYEKVV